MDLQMVIPIRATDIPFKGHDVPVAVSRTNMSPLSYAALRDHELVNDLRLLAVLSMCVPMVLSQRTNKLRGESGELLSESMAPYPLDLFL
jgi:hypothetical protein